MHIKANKQKCVDVFKALARATGLKNLGQRALNLQNSRRRALNLQGLSLKNLGQRGFNVWLSMVMLCGALGLGACASTPEKRKKTAALYLEIGSNHLRAGHKPRALKALLRAVQLDPKSSRVQDRLGVVYFLLQQHDKALFHAQRAVRLDTSNTDARFNLGRMYVERSEYDKAIQHLHIAAKDLTYNQQYKVWLNLGWAYFYQNKYNRALGALNKSRSYGSNCENTNWQARALYALKRYKSAVQTYDEAERLCQGTQKAETQYWRGMAHYRLRDWLEARLQFGQAMRTAPDSQYARRAARRLASLKPVNKEPATSKIEK